MAEALNKEFLVNTHEASIGLIKADLENSPLEFDDKKFVEAFIEVKEKLSREGQRTVNSLEDPKLNAFLEELKRGFEQDYPAVVEGSIEQLRLHNDPKRAIQEAKKLTANTKMKFQGKLGEIFGGWHLFNVVDKEKLITAFNHCIDDVTFSFLKKKLNSSDDVKLRLAADADKDKGLSTNRQATFQATELKNTSSLRELDPPSPEPKSGITVVKKDLEERLIYAIAGKKPGEKLVINLSVPNRDNIIAEMNKANEQRSQGGGVAGSMAALILLLLYLVTRCFIKNNEKGNEKDQQKIADVINKLYKTYGLSIDPEEVSLKISQVNEKGREKVLQEGPLPAAVLQGLRQVKQEVQTVLQNSMNRSTRKTPSFTPDEGYSSANEEEEENQRNAISPFRQRPSLGL